MKGDASQKFIPIKAVHDGVVQLEDGSYISIIMSNSLNLALKSQDEQSAIITQFQNFFNALDFPLQIFVKSRRANMEGYIASLKDRLKYIDSDMLKLQTTEYISYIEDFTSEVNIMEKEFFVIISYTPALTGEKSTGAGVFNTLFNKSEAIDAASMQIAFKKIKQQLEERTSVVISGLTRCGLKLTVLNTEEVMELFYELFNPGIEAKTLMN